MEDSKKRILRNTLFLYGRMLLIMAASLYTSRVVLNALGIVDFGIFNVVGGVISLVGFLNSSLTTTTQRFLNVEMSIGTKETLNSIFCQAVNAHIIVGIICVFLLQTVGLWFVVNKLVIPDKQFINALWVYECTIGILFVSIISAPYNAAFIANEKMSVFAYLSILDALLRLLIAFTIMIVENNRLRLYAILLLVIAVIMRVIYGKICIKLFQECRYRLIWDWSVIRKMFNFSGWMIFGTFSDLLAGQGVNMLINIFFGPILNAARAIAVQVQAAVSQFSSNFMISVNPQIVKSYSAQETEKAYNLVFQSSKLSFILMLIVVIPISIRTQDILTLWLKEVPEEASVFVQLILLEYLIRSSYTPLAQINVAYGRIQLYQLSISILFTFIFIGTFLLYKMGYPVYSTFILSVIIAVIGLFLRLSVLKKQNNFPLGKYLRSISLPLGILLILAYTTSYEINKLFSENFLGLLTSCITSFIICIVLSWKIALNQQERYNISIRLNKILNKIK